MLKPANCELARPSIERRRVPFVAKSLVKLTLLAAFLTCSSLPAQTIRLTERIQLSGVVKSVRAGEITVAGDDGKQIRCKIQGKDQQGIALDGADALLRFPAQVTVKGEYAIDELKPGMLLRFEAAMNRIGRTSGKVQSAQVIDEKSHPLGVEVKQPAEKSSGYSKCVVTAELFSLTARSKRFVVTLTPNEFTKKPRLSFQFETGAKIQLESDDYRRGKPGDEVVSLVAFKASTGDILVKELELKLAKPKPTKKPTRTVRGSAGQGKYRNLSDAPKPPRDLSSPHFLLHTDISDRQARVLLDKLETMITLVSQYYGAPPKGIIECYVVRDLDNWKGPPTGQRRGEDFRTSRRDTLDQRRQENKINRLLLR